MKKLLGILVLGLLKYHPINYGTKMAIKTNTCSTSLRLHRLPLTFALSFSLEMLTKAD